MTIPDDLLYSKDHEWMRIVNDIATIGMTDYAQGELGDIIFIEFPNKGVKFNTGDPIGTIEAVKTVADIYSPVDGEILEVNIALENQPESINNDPYEKGWIFKLCKIHKDSSNLLTAAEYKNMIK